MQMTSNKPYLIRAFYEWIVDNEMTPHILVDATVSGVEVPDAYVKDGKIVLNISPEACRGLQLQDDKILFTARFGQLTSQIVVLMTAVLAIYAEESRRGMEFAREDGDDDSSSIGEKEETKRSRLPWRRSEKSSKLPWKKDSKRPVLTLVKKEGDES